MSDIRKVREWVDSDEPEPEDGWEWPAPPIRIESVVVGDLRATILSKIGRPADDAAEVRIIESECEGGWSEFTVETDYGIEVWLHEGSQAQRVWEKDAAWTAESAMAAFLAWTEPTPTPEAHATDAGGVA